MAVLASNIHHSDMNNKPTLPAVHEGMNEREGCKKGYDVCIDLLQKDLAEI
jgi:hypothetical protein